MNIDCSYRYFTGADPGIYVGGGGALDRRGVWGPSRSPAGPGQRPVGGPGGRSPPLKLMGIPKKYIK